MPLSLPPLPSPVASLRAQAPADIVLLNGKIVTVDDRFMIAEALAIKGERIVAVGSNGEIEKHKGRARASLTSTVAP